MEDDEYILKDRDGSYVSAIKSGGTATVPFIFEFTTIRAKAKVFKEKELWDPKSSSVAIEFTKGFAGGEAIRLAPF